MATIGEVAGSTSGNIGRSSGSIPRALVPYDPKFAAIQAAPARRVVVELGAGDYINAMAWHDAHPNDIVYATNLRSEVELGEMLSQIGDDSFVTKFYEGWKKASQPPYTDRMRVGYPKPFENQNIPDGIADIVFTIAPYPRGAAIIDPAVEAASMFGSQAARIARHRSGTVIAMTSRLESSLDAFSGAFQAVFEARTGIRLIPERLEGEAPFGDSYINWETGGGKVITLRYTVP